MVKITNWAIYTVAAHGRNSSLYADIGSAVNRPTVNRGLMDGRPADRSTGPTKIVDRPNKQKKARSARRQLGRPWVNVSNPGAKWLRFCSWLKFYNNNKKNLLFYICIFFLFLFPFQSLIYQATHHPSCRANVANEKLCYFLLHDLSKNHF